MKFKKRNNNWFFRRNKNKKPQKIDTSLPFLEQLKQHRPPNIISKIPDEIIVSNEQLLCATKKWLYESDSSDCMLIILLYRIPNVRELATKLKMDARELVEKCQEVVSKL